MSKAKFATSLVVAIVGWFPLIQPVFALGLVHVECTVASVSPLRIEVSDGTVITLLDWDETGRPLEPDDHGRSFPAKKVIPDMSVGRVLIHGEGFSYEEKRLRGPGSNPSPSKISLFGIFFSPPYPGFWIVAALAILVLVWRKLLRRKREVKVDAI